MDIQAEKIQLIEWLASLNKPSIIKKLVALKQKEKDWWDEISEDEKVEIKKGLAQADRGHVVPHHKVMGKYKKWLSK
jgi:predicted transcriptional regulator